MKNITYSIIIFVLSALLNIYFVNAKDGTDITLLHVNDSHSHLDAFGPKDVNLNGTLGGISKAATIIGTIKASEPNVLLVHGGDFMVGDFFFNQYYGVPELQIMMQLGFDALTVGNHEFDLGPEALAGVLSEAFQGSSIPLISANLDMSGYPALETWIAPGTMKTIDGVKIGIFGLTIPDPMNNASPVVIREDIIPIAAQTVAQLKSNGANVIILVSHLGIMYDQQIAANLTGIDFIVSAHDHNLLTQPIVVPNPEGKNVRIMEAGSDYQAVGKLKFNYNGGNIAFISYESIPVDASVTPDPTIEGIINTLKDGIVAQYGDVYHTVIGTASTDLVKSAAATSENKDTPLGNLVTDAFRYKTNTTIAITANGLIAEKIWQGPIVGADVFHAVSYGFDPQTGLGFKLITFDMEGKELIKGLEIGLSQIEINEDYFIQVSGMTFKYSAKRPAGHRVIDGSVKIGNEPLVPHRLYSITVNEGLYGLLTNMGVQVQNVAPTDIFEYNALKEFISHLNVVNYVSEGRVKDMSLNPHNKSGEFVSKPEVKKFIVYGNFPNPFNPSTIISYQLPVNSHVNVTVYDIIGREVKVLVDDIQQAGKYEITFDGSRLSSGIYIYRFMTNGFVESRKMILVK